MKTVLTLGSFDGVHLGHQLIFKTMKQLAVRHRAKTKAMMFAIPPRLVQQALQERSLLLTPSEKSELLQSLEIDQIQTLQFTPSLSALTPEAFFKKFVCHQSKAVAMVVGPKVTFGKNRSGQLKELYLLGEKYGVEIQTVAIRTNGKAGISSRDIRTWVELGEFVLAKKALGYSYFIQGKVVHGDGRGKTIGFPTANVLVDSGKILPRGVFWVRVEPATSKLRLHHLVKDRGVDGICNVGIRPTFQGKDVSVEVHLLKKPSGSLYGRKLRISFVEKIRSEKRFGSVHELVRQIQQDRNWVLRKISRRKMK